MLCYGCIVSGKQNTPDIEILDPVDDSAARAAIAGDDAAVMNTENFDTSDGAIDVTDVIDVDAADDVEALDAPDANASLLATPEVLTPSPKAVAKKKASTSSSSSLEPVSALSAYMSQLANHAPISREEEHELAVRWVEDGDVEAARKMVLSNLRLVVKIAMEYRRAWTNTLDLIQEGNTGLMKPVEK